MQKKKKKKKKKKKNICVAICFGLRQNIASLTGLQRYYDKERTNFDRIPNSFNLTFATPLANSADDRLMIFFLFSQKTGFDISCKLSPVEAICLKCQNLFPGKKKKKNISIGRVLKISPRVLKVRQGNITRLGGIIHSK